MCVRCVQCDQCVFSVQCWVWSVRERTARPLLMNTNDLVHGRPPLLEGPALSFFLSSFSSCLSSSSSSSLSVISPSWWIQTTWHMGDHLCCSAQWDRIWIPIEWFPSGSNLFALQTVPRLSRQPRSPKSGVNSYKLWRYLMKSSNDNMDFQQQQNHTKDTKYHRERVQTTNQMLDLQSTRFLMLQLCGWTVLPLRSAQKILHTRQTLHF